MSGPKLGALSSKRTNKQRQSYLFTNCWSGGRYRWAVWRRARRGRGANRRGRSRRGERTGKVRRRRLDISVSTRIDADSRNVPHRRAFNPPRHFRAVDSDLARRAARRAGSRGADELALVTNHQFPRTALLNILEKNGDEAIREKCHSTHDDTTHASGLIWIMRQFFELVAMGCVGGEIVSCIWLVDSRFPASPQSCIGRVGQSCFRPWAPQHDVDDWLDPIQLAHSHDAHLLPRYSVLPTPPEFPKLALWNGRKITLLSHRKEYEWLWTFRERMKRNVPS